MWSKLHQQLQAFLCSQYPYAIIKSNNYTGWKFWIVFNWNVIHPKYNLYGIWLHHKDYTTVKEKKSNIFPSDYYYFLINNSEETRIS